MAKRRLWCGFNYPVFRDPPQAREGDFKQAADWGFSFIRLPVFTTWFEPENTPGVFDEGRLKYLDNLIAWCRKYGLHADLNMHHPPGFGVSFIKRGIPITLWTSEDMLQRTENIWRMFAERYASEGDYLSFNLVNEPVGTDLGTYRWFVRRMVKAIRSVTPERYVTVDALMDQTTLLRIPIPGLEDLPLIIQSFRNYEPGWFTHLAASWSLTGDLYQEQPEYPGVPPNIGKYLEKLPMDSPLRPWFLNYMGIRIDKTWLEHFMRPFFQFRNETGAFIHCGEMGVYTKKVDRVSYLNWFRDVLDILKEHDVGWALWNFRGPFGVVNTERPDFPLEKMPSGDLVDRELLEILQSHL